MILGNEVSLAAYKKMLNKNNNTEQLEDMQSNKGLLSRSQNTKTLNSGDTHNRCGRVNCSCNYRIYKTYRR